MMDFKHRLTAQWQRAPAPRKRLGLTQDRFRGPTLWVGTGPATRALGSRLELELQFKILMKVISFTSPNQDYYYVYFYNTCDFFHKKFIFKNHCESVHNHKAAM